MAPVTEKPKLDVAFVPSMTVDDKVTKPAGKNVPKADALTAPPLPGATKQASGPGGVALPPTRGSSVIDSVTTDIQPSVQFGILGRFFDWLLSLFGAGSANDMKNSGKAYVAKHPEYLQAARAQFEMMNTNPRRTFEDAMAFSIADKVKANSKAKGTELSDDEALEYGKAMVAGMLEAEKSLPADAPKTPEAAAKKVAAEVGEPFKSAVDKLDAQLASKNPGDVAMAKDSMRQLLSIMIAKRDGLTKGIPDSLMKDWTNAIVNPTIGYDTRRAIQFMNAIAVLEPSARAELCEKLESVPEDRRGAVMMAMTTETAALESSKDAVRERAWKRIDQACLQATKLSDVEFKQVQGVLGLDKIGDVKIKGPGGKELAVPVYAHPGVEKIDRDIAMDLYTKALGSYPFPLMEKLAAGEDGRPFAVTVEPTSNVFMDGANRVGMYDTEANVIRLAGGYMRSSGAQTDGRHDLTHEIGHAVDDMLQPGSSDEMTAAKGLLKGHFDAARAVRRPELLGLPSSYAATAVPEYWAESMAFYARNKESREHLKTSDPVMFKVCERFFALCKDGKLDDAKALVQFGTTPPEELAKRPLGSVADDLHAFTEGYAVPVEAFKDQTRVKQLKELRGKELDAVIAYTETLVTAAAGGDKAAVARMQADLAKLKEIRAAL